MAVLAVSIQVWWLVKREGIRVGVTRIMFYIISPTPIGRFGRGQRYMATKSRKGHKRNCRDLNAALRREGHIGSKLAHLAWYTWAEY